MSTKEKIQAIVEKKFPRWMDEDYDVHTIARHRYAEALEDLLMAGGIDKLYEVEVSSTEYERALYYQSAALR